MNKIEIVEAIMAGSRIIVGEYLKTDTKPSNDGNGVIKSHKFLLGDSVGEIAEFPPKPGKPVRVVIPPGLLPRSMVVIEWRTWEDTKFGLRINGTVSTLETTGGNASQAVPAHQGVPSASKANPVRA